MNLVKKGLNFIVWSFIAVAVGTLLIIVDSLIPAFTEGDLPDSMVKTMNVIMFVASIVMFCAGIFEFVGYAFGKMGKNKRYTIAFWLQIFVLVIQLVNIILGIVGVRNEAVVLTFSFILAGAQIATSLFACTACGEAVPEMRTLSIVTLIFLAVGYLFTALSDIKGIEKALVSFGSIFALVSVILYIILVVKTRNRIKA